jgi:hypothetical protein
VWQWNALCLALMCLAASLALGGWLWWSCRKALSRMREMVGAETRRLEEERAALGETLGECRRRMEEISAELEALRRVHTPLAGMTLTKRALAVRMHRRGERPEQIAAALDLPKQEVELLLKIHRAAAA